MISEVMYLFMSTQIWLLLLNLNFKKNYTLLNIPSCSLAAVNMWRLHKSIFSGGFIALSTLHTGLWIMQAAHCRKLESYTLHFNIIITSNLHDRKFWIHHAIFRFRRLSMLTRIVSFCLSFSISLAVFLDFWMNSMSYLPCILGACFFF